MSLLDKLFKKKKKTLKILHLGKEISKKKNVSFIICLPKTILLKIYNEEETSYDEVRRPKLIQHSRFVNQNGKVHFTDPFITIFAYTVEVSSQISNILSLSNQLHILHRLNTNLKLYWKRNTKIFNHKNYPNLLSYIDDFDYKYNYNYYRKLLLNYLTNNVSFARTLLLEILLNVDLCTCPNYLIKHLRSSSLTQSYKLLLYFSYFVYLNNTQLTLLSSMSFELDDLKSPKSSKFSKRKCKKWNLINLNVLYAHVLAFLLSILYMSSKLNRSINFRKITRNLFA